MLAIVIPYYKKIFFEETLDSLVKQTNKNFKVYIGNDNSPDNPVDLLSRYEKKLDITYKKFSNNLGKTSLISQWNRCIAMANGEEWVTILGDDDYYSPSVVQRFYDRIEDHNQNDANLIRFSSQLVNDQSQIVSDIFEHPRFENAQKAFLRRFYNETRSSLSEYFFRKEVYDKFSFHDFPLGWHSDDMAWLQFSNNKPIESINESIIYIRCSEKNISGQADLWQIKNFSSREFYKKISQNHFHQFERKDQNAILERYIYLLFHTQIFKHKNLLRLLSIILRYPRKAVFLVTLVNFRKRLKK
ncbi:glycosyltransferase family 2 protein [Salinimicrobium catena]|uniref:glycosyltransferase family 2 protein n=1 Tax=Salinimicrobium catena TaxID=390640 RepID=UPI002FE4D2D2